MSYRRLLALVGNLSADSIFIRLVEEYKEENRSVTPQEIMRLF